MPLPEEGLDLKRKSQIARCPKCHEFIDASSCACRFCGAVLNADEMQASAALQDKITREKGRLNDRRSLVYAFLSLLGVLAAGSLRFIRGWQQQSLRLAGNPPDPTTTARLTVKVDNFGIAFNDVRIPAEVRLAHLKRILGAPTRSVQKPANTIYVWDGAGIIAYEKQGTDRISSLSFQFMSGGLDFSPKSRFRGHLSLNGVPITESATLASFEASAPGIKKVLSLPSIPVATYVVAGRTVTIDQMNSRTIKSVEVRVAPRESNR